MRPGLPTVAPDRLVKMHNPGGWWVCAYVTCPYCGKEHGHTWTTDHYPEPAVGYRCNPCGASSDGYVLVESKQT